MFSINAVLILFTSCEKLIGLISKGNQIVSHSSGYKHVYFELLAIDFFKKTEL